MSKETTYFTQKAPHPHEIALAQRDREISLLWSRSNYYLVLNSALLVALFSNVGANFRPLICLFGAGFCILWVGTNIGSKFWQERWELAAKITEPEYLNKDQKLFQSSKEELRLELKDHWGSQGRSSTFKYLIGLAPSVSQHLIALSAAFFSVWMCLLGIFLLGAIESTAVCGS